MTTDLTEIDGIGPSYAEELEQAGFESAEDVAAGDADELDAVLDTHSGSDIKDSASEVAGPQETEFDTTEDGRGSGEYHEFDYDLDEDQRNHLIKGLVNEEIRARRTNKAVDVEMVKDAIGRVMSDESLSLTKEQLDTAYRAMNQLESEYRSQRGVGTFTTKISNLKNALQEARSEAHPDNE